MSLSRRHTIAKAAQPASPRSIQWPFDWIDAIAVPIATSIMETQPFTVVLLFLTLLVTGKSADVPLDSASITLLLLGLHWWPLLLKRLQGWKLREKLEGPLQFFGLLFALAVTIVTHPVLLTDAQRLLFVVALVLWFWVRGRRRALVEADEEQLIFSFKLCFIVLLVVLLVALPVNPAIAEPTLAALALALPLFFVSGLLALSFVRLSIIRHEYRRDVFATRRDDTRAWSLFLALAWTMFVIVSMLLETFAFQPLLFLITPLINIIEYAVSSLIQLFSQRQPPPVYHRLKITPVPVTHPSHVTLHISLGLPIIILIFIISLVILLASLLLLIWFLYTLRDTLFRRAKKGDDEQEALDMLSILRERRKKKQGKTRFRLEPLHPNSIRIRYRDLLLATARRGGDIQRFPHETPSEYRWRILSMVETLPNKEGEPTNMAILTELTEAYTPERYGRTKTEQGKVGYFKRWVPYLVKRIRRIKI